MPRMFDPHWRNDGDGDQMSLGGPTPVTNTDYDSDDSVADADPRIISNLIVDQTPSNPAAIIASLNHAGFEGDKAVAVSEIQAVHQHYKAAADTLTTATHARNAADEDLADEIGRAPSRERVSHYGMILGVAVALQTKN